jgi:Cytochrome P450
MIMSPSLAIVHRLMTDDVYEGAFLPAGSLVLGNTWCVNPAGTVTSFLPLFSRRAILQDEHAYKDPETFNPDRFLKDGKLDPNVRSPEVAAFGFGRRYASFPCLFFFFGTLASRCTTLLKDMSWTTPRAFIDVFDFRLFIGRFRHRQGYRREWRAYYSKGSVYFWCELVCPFQSLTWDILLQRHSSFF